MKKWEESDKSLSESVSYVYFLTNREKLIIIPNNSTMFLIMVVYSFHSLAKHMVKPGESFLNLYYYSIVSWNVMGTF